MWGHVENIALDLHVKHSNNYIKQANRNVDPNLTAVNHTCTVNHAEKKLKNLLTQIDKAFKEFLIQWNMHVALYNRIWMCC